ncbi:unnamed protein product [Oppiella nova]|uniref:Uncharacterized protein n=1 Tax=Oppiella nova TaxID=334625 RepID=A0A7R9LJP9_9ACAR|nr:unnamed protein product [Oppiella nova]CAG2164310.1 unnamed protein product [Oppiella nova]
MSELVGNYKLGNDLKHLKASIGLCIPSIAHNTYVNSLVIGKQLAKIDSFQQMMNMPIMVPFFLISGFLQSYGYIKRSNADKSSAIDYFIPVRNIVNRFVRLTPSIAAAIGVAILLTVMASGPKWYWFADLVENTYM